MNKKNNVGCLGFGLAIFVIAVIVQVVKWTFTNILGVLGIGAIIVGIYLVFDHKKKNLSLYWPIFAIASGFFLSFFWFVFQEGFNTLAAVFLLMFLYFLGTAIFYFIRKNNYWKRFSGLAAALFVSSMIFMGISPDIEDEPSKQKVVSEKVTNEIKKTEINNDVKETEQVIAEQKEKEEAEKLAAEQKAKEEEARLAEEQRKREEEAQRIAEEQRKEEEEAQRIAEEQRRQQEEAERLAEQQRLAEEQAQKETVTNVYYKNCTEARAAGAAPVYAGQPGYGKHLDRDGDGIGCDR